MYLGRVGPTPPSHVSDSLISGIYGEDKRSVVSSCLGTARSVTVEAICTANSGSGGVGVDQWLAIRSRVGELWIPQLEFAIQRVVITERAATREFEDCVDSEVCSRF